MIFNRRIQNTPHPSIIPLVKRVWLDATDRNNTIFNGSDVQSWLKKNPSSVSVTQNTAVNQPADGGTAIDYDDAGNNQFLTAGADYPFVASGYGGVSVFMLIKNDQVSPGGGQFKFVCDFGNYSTTGWGVMYASNEIGCYTPTAHGGKLTLKRPVTNPKTGYVTAGVVIKFGADQTLYVDNIQEAQAIISVFQLTTNEIDERSFPTLSGGPFTVGGGSKSPPESRWFKGTIKIVLMLFGALSDYQRKQVHTYLRNKELV